MAGEPTTVNVALIIPNTGDLVDVWGAQAINPDMSAIDGFLGGVQTITVAGSPITLTVPAGFTATPGGGPTQAQNLVLKLSGTVISSVQITLPMPGSYIMDTVGLSVNSLGPVTLRAVGAGETIALPFGTAQRIYNDGTNVRFVNLQTVGTYLDSAGTTVPSWISGCSKPPFLLCDGSPFSAVTYPVLAAILGTTTLPDFRGRGSFFVNGGTSRLTSAGAGIDGNTLFASGGVNGITLNSANQLPAHTHTNTLTDPGHIHTPNPTLGHNTGQLVSVGSGNAGQGALGGGDTSSAVTGITINNASTGAGANIPNVGPGIVGGIRLIRAG